MKELLAITKNEVGDDLIELIFLSHEPTYEISNTNNISKNRKVIADRTFVTKDHLKKVISHLCEEFDYYPDPEHPNE